MKTLILDYLRLHPNRTSPTIARDIGQKKASVSKCLTRLVRTGEVHFQRQGGFCYFLLPVKSSTPETSASAVANS